MRRQHIFHIAASIALFVVVLAGCTAAGSEESAVLRGDEAFARGDMTEALAEYRLALRQGDPEAPVLMRTAHAYAVAGRIAEARDHYLEAIELEPEMKDLAVADLLRVAKRATERNQGIAAAAAVEAAMLIEPGVSLTGVALPLARHFRNSGRYGEALPFFIEAVRESGSDPAVVYEMALAYAELGDCERALVFLEQVRGDLTFSQRSEADWQMGSCSHELAREARAGEDFEEALRFYEATIAAGEPRSRLAESWYEVGEIRASLGDCELAVEAFEQVQRQDLATNALVERARTRIDEIRFRRGGEGPC